MFRGLRYPLAVVAAVAVLTVAAFAGDAARPQVDRSSVHDFLSRHWRRPLVPQGTPPARFSRLEASLAAQSCGTCHPAQHADWKTALHAKSMGPGLTGQVKELRTTDPESARL